MTLLGTALTPSATRALILGAGELSEETVIAFQRLGVETIAADRQVGAPARQVAHHARTLDMTDGQRLRDLVLTERPDAVVPGMEAIATPVLEELEAEDGLRVVPHRSSGTPDDGQRRHPAARR